MPIYEYRCQDCGERFEKLVLGSGNQEVRCPKCESIRVEKMISAFATAGVTETSSASSTSGSCCQSTSGFS